MHELSPFHSWSAVSPYALALGLTALLAAVLLLRGVRRRSQAGAPQLMLMTAAAGLWALLYSFELATPTLAAKVFWAKTEYLGIVLIPVAWYLFARAYTGAGKRPDRWVLAMIGLVPVVTLFLAVSNDFHSLVWSNVSLVSSGAFPVLELARGPWYWVNVTYCYGLMAAGELLLVRSAFTHPSPYRRGVAAILLASLAPWVGNALSTFWLEPSRGLDITPFAFALTAVVMLLATSRLNLFSLFPALLRVARTQVLEKMADAVIVLDLEGRVVTSNPAAQRLFNTQMPDLTGVSIEEILGGALPIQSEGGEEADLQFGITLGRGDSERYFDVVSSPLGLGPGYGMGRLLVLRDITERRRAEGAATAARESLRARIVELNALLHMAETVAGPADLDGTLMTAANEIANALEAKAAAVVTFGEEGQTYLLVSASEVEESTPEDVLLRNVYGYFEAIAELAQGGAPVVINDLAPGACSRSLLQQAEVLGLSHLLAVPLILQAKTIGGLAVVRRADAPGFSEREVGFVQSAASTAAAAIVHARLREEENQKTASQVREHLARELHDAVTQSVYSANLMAQALPVILQRDEAEGLAGIMQLQRLVRSALAELRILLYELRPATFVGVGLDQLLERLGDSIAGQANVNVAIDTRLDYEVPLDVKTAVYRIAQESFNNIAKHARAERVWATAVSDAQGITLDIEDDGIGIETDTVAAEAGGHMGLGIMQERAEEIGAEFGIHKIDPSGTQVTVRWNRPDACVWEGDLEKALRRRRQPVSG
jgi:PAS domain S-box-containing protein